LEAYIKMVELRNPIGVYSVARYALELPATTRFMRDELIRIKGEPKEEHYNELCDFVHHNLSSQTIGTTKITKSSRRQVINSTFIYPTSIPIVHYEYPNDLQARYAIETTVKKVKLNLIGIMEELTSMPFSPYSEEELLEYTGNRKGRTEIATFSEIDTEKVGRNDPCPCGSGRKSKHCHGKT
jgi:SEC-C motif